MVVLTLACPVATSSDPLLPRPGPLPTRLETAEEAEVELEEEEEGEGPEHRQIDQQVRPTTLFRPGSINYLGEQSIIWGPDS